MNSKRHNKKFSSVKLLEGVTCDILDITPMVLWRATLNCSLQKEFDITPFVLEQILLFDGEKRDLDYIENLYIDDYLKISEVVTVLLSKLPK